MPTDFDPREFDERYEFRNGKVYHKKRPDKPLTPQLQTNQEGFNYSYYHLVRNDGVRAKVSTFLASGKVERVGDLYQLAHWPKGWEARAGWPAYLFNSVQRKVRRVGFKVPRIKPTSLKPDALGRFRLLDAEGEYRWVHSNDLFGDE